MNGLTRQENRIRVVTKIDGARFNSFWLDKIMNR